MNPDSEYGAERLTYAGASKLMPKVHIDRVLADLKASRNVQLAERLQSADGQPMFARMDIASSSCCQINGHSRSADA